VALAFLAALFWVRRESRIRGLEAGKALDLSFYIILSAILGSRLFHVLISERARFFDNPLMFFRIWEGGLVFYGGLIACLLVSVWYFRRHKLPFWTYADVFSPAISLGHAIGRLGCFMAGCCYGKPLASKTWYSVTFPERLHSFAPVGIPLYPTQLMESAGEFLIFGLLLLVRSKKKFEGQLLGTYLLAYAVLRFFVEYFRGDVVRGFVIEPWLSTSQLISIIIFIVGLSIYVIQWHKNKHSEKK
jgi:phosphatidylglycerol:prolipoprotein diacylglycerol transferase